MTSPSRKRRPTTRWSTSPASQAEARAADAYRAVDAATRPRSGEPLWLPSGWLAVVVLLTLAAQSWGATAGDGWRARRTTTKTASVARPIRQVGFEDDIAGPALRTAQRVRTDRIRERSPRLAQQETPGGDPLLDSLRRPFGVDEKPDNEQSGSLFDDLPAPTESPAPEASVPQPALEPDAQTADSLFDSEEPAPAPPTEPPDSLFDDEPARRDYFDDRTDADLADDLAAPFGANARESDEERREEAMKDCRKSLEELKASRLSDIDLNIAVEGIEGEAVPFTCSLDDGSILAPRMWCEVTYMWKASGLCHKPLYFEDVHLERYGHSWGPYVQPLVSGAHFFGRLPVLPYMMGLKMPNECVYTLGHYRPGDCAPYLIDPVPFTWRAALMQAGGTMGVVGILP